MTTLPNTFEKAVDEIGVRRVLHHGAERVVLACLIREADWRPLKAPWWRGKEVYIIGADLNGNFFLRHSDGSVRYWRHAEAADSVVAPSVRAFAALVRFE